MEVGETTPQAYRPQAVLKDDLLPFVFEPSGSETQYTNGFDPHPNTSDFSYIPKMRLAVRALWFRLALSHDSGSHLSGLHYSGLLQAVLHLVQSCSHLLLSTHTSRHHEIRRTD